MFLSLVFSLFLNHTATTEIYTLSLHDALPIWRHHVGRARRAAYGDGARRRPGRFPMIRASASRSEEHTSELQSLTNLVCRLLLEKKKKRTQIKNINRLIVNTSEI